MDRLIETIDPLKNVMALKYDVHSNLIKEINPNFYDPGTGDGIGVEYVYDESNRKIKTLYPTKGVARTEYDPAGNIIKTVGPGVIYDGHHGARAALETGKYIDIEIVPETIIRLLAILCGEN